MTDLRLPMPTADVARSIYGSSFDPDRALNGAVALAAAGDLASLAVALMKAIFACPAQLKYTVAAREWRKVIIWNLLKPWSPPI